MHYLNIPHAEKMLRLPSSADKAVLLKYYQSRV